MSTQDISRGRMWVMASRPQTLPTAAAPIVVGTAVAIRADLFAPLPTFVALVSVLLIQVGTNFANDCYDTVQGTDTKARESFTRVTTDGLIPPSEIERAMYLTFAAAVLLGAYLVYIDDVPILVVGLLSVASDIAYASGPYPPGYHGLGDSFVFVFFGLVAVADTFYVQTASVPAAPLFAGIPAGAATLVAVPASLPITAISTNILIVNNIRDKEEDATTGKRTSAVRFDYGSAHAEYIIMLALAYAVPVYLWARAGFNWFVLLPMFSMPVTARITRTVMIETKGEKLNPAFENTGKLLTLYAILFSIGLVLA